MKIRRLNKKDIEKLLELSEHESFPYVIDRNTAELCCTGHNPNHPTIQTYGVFIDDNKLVSIMTATYSYIFPKDNNKSGRIVTLSGAFTLPDHRYVSYATKLIKTIESDAKEFFKAEIMYCDSNSDGLFVKTGFKYVPHNESRLMKLL